MGKTIFITEKPSVAQEYCKVLKVMRGGKTNGYIEGHSEELNKDVIITWAVGHLIELGNVDEQIEHRVIPKKEYEEVKRKWTRENLPIIPKDYVYKPNGSTYDQFKVVKEVYSRKDIDAIYYAGDSGREGIYIQALIRNQIFKTAPKFDEKVVWIDSFTEEAILKGIREAKPYTAYQNMIDSGYSRAKSDWLIGMNETQAFTITSHGLVVVGRVMTPTLTMIVDRQNEIDNFTKTSFYGVKANDTAYWKANAGQDYAPLDFPYNENGFLKRDDAEALKRNFETDMSLKVEKVTKTHKKELAPLLFNLADLQNHCSKKYHITPAQTLEIAQSLYEKKVTTYPRTDARVISTAVAKEYHDKFGFNIPKKYVDDSKITDHYAIIPTFYKASLSGLEAQVYDDIMERFMNIMKPAHEYDAVSVVYIHSNGEHFYEGWKKVTVRGWKNYRDEEEADKVIPDEGEVIDVRAFDIREMETKPPVAYTTGSMIMAMEKAGKLIEDEELREQIKTCGIGTSATRANIIEKLAEKNFITINGKTQKIEPTELGKKIVSVVRKFDKALTSPEMTAELEQKLADIADGKLSQEDYMKDMNSHIAHMVKVILNGNTENLGSYGGGKSGADHKDYDCPCCGKPLKYGKFGYYCNKNDGGCGFSVGNDWFGVKLTDKDITDILTKGGTGSKKMLSKDKKPYYAKVVVDKANHRLTREFDNTKSSSSSGGGYKKSAPKQSSSKPKNNSNVEW